MLRQRLSKLKNVTTPNWVAPRHSQQQLQYTANDAHASLLVYQALSEMPAVSEGRS